MPYRTEQPSQIMLHDLKTRAKKLAKRELGELGRRDLDRRLVFIGAMDRGICFEIRADAKEFDGVGSAYLFFADDSCTLCLPDGTKRLVTE